MPCSWRVAQASSTENARGPGSFVWVGRQRAIVAPHTITIHRGARRARILIEAFFALRATVVSAWSAPTKSRARRPRARGPRRPKGLVMVTHGHESYPAAGSRRRLLGKKFTTSNDDTEHTHETYVSCTFRESLSPKSDREDSVQIRK